MHVDQASHATDLRQQAPRLVCGVGLRCRPTGWCGEMQRHQTERATINRPYLDEERLAARVAGQRRAPGRCRLVQGDRDRFDRFVGEPVAVDAQRQADPALRRPGPAGPASRRRRVEQLLKAVGPRRRPRQDEDVRIEIVKSATDLRAPHPDRRRAAVAAAAAADHRIGIAKPGPGGEEVVQWVEVPQRQRQPDAPRPLRTPGVVTPNPGQRHAAPETALARPVLRRAPDRASPASAACPHLAPPAPPAGFAGWRGASEEAGNRAPVASESLGPRLPRHVVEHGVHEFRLSALGKEGVCDLHKLDNHYLGRRFVRRPAPPLRRGTAP